MITQTKMRTMITTMTTCMSLVYLSTLLTPIFQQFMAEHMVRSVSLMLISLTLKVAGMLKRRNSS